MPVTRPLTDNQETTLRFYRQPPPPNRPDALTRGNVHAGFGKWTVLGFAAVCRGLVSRGLAEEILHDPERPRNGSWFRLTRAGKDLAAELRRRDG
jgi:hypothetical protein